MTKTMLKRKLALLIIFVLLFGSLPISSAEGIGLEVKNVDESAGEVASESGEEPGPVAEEPPAEELPPVEEVAPPQEPPVDISPIEEEPPEEPIEEPLPVEEEPIEQPLPVEEDEEQPIEAEEETDPSQEIDESQKDESEETEPETTEPEKDEADEDEEEVSDDAYGVDGPINNPGTGQVYYTGEIGASSPSLNRFLQNMLLTENPVMGVDHPANPGEIMLFKEAKPVEGKVNTWRITVRVEAKETQKSNDIVLVLDTSGSMSGSKLSNTKAAAKQFIDQLLTPEHPQTRIKLVTFAGNVTDHHSSLSDFVNYSGAAELKNTIDTLYADGGTFTQGALRYARNALGTSSADLKQIVLLSDGEPTYGYSITNPGSYLSLQYIGSASSFDDWRTHAPGGNRKATRADVPESSFTTTRTGLGSRMFHRYHNPDGTANDEYYNFGNSAIAEAGFAKASGYTIHTIAMDAGTQGTSVLQGIASPGNAYATNNPTELASIFATIASKILSAMTNAAANDPMGTGFEVVGNVSNISASTGPDSYQLNGQTISWTIGTPSKPLESDPTIKYEWLSYEVEINDDILLLDPPADGLYFTNGDTRISFTDIGGVNQNLPFPKPQVDPVLWIAEKVLLDAQGNVITPSDPSSAIFPLQVTGGDYNRTIQMNPGDGGLRKLLTDLRAQQTYTVAEVANGYSYGDVAFDEFDKKIEIRLGNGSFAETNQFIITADANGIPNQDVYIRVTNTMPETSVRAKKVWDDSNSNNRPEIYFQLYRQVAGGELEVVPATATTPNPVLVPASLEVAWNSLAQYDSDGNQYSFVVKEVTAEGIDTVPPGYVKTEVYDEENDIWVITNRYVPVTITKTVSKIWDDNDNAAGYRPDSIKVILYADGTPVREVILNESNNWTHTWIDLPQGPVYTVREEPVPPRYSVEYEYIPMTLSDSYVRIEPGNEMEFPFAQLGYPSYYVAKKGNQFLVWTMGQLNDLQKAEFLEQFRALNVNGFNGISLSSTTFVDGLEFGYEGMNISVPLQKFWFSYKSAWSMFAFGQYHDKVEVTNKYDPASVTATKVWDDQEDKYGLRPDSITLQLMQNSVPFGAPVTVTPDDDGNWSYTWHDLPKVDAAGKAYVYTVVETPVPGYLPPDYSQNGLTVTNRLDVTAVTANKVWDDMEDAYGLRPDSITLQLQQNGKNLGAPVTVTPDDDGNWSYTWENLPKVDADGEAYIYTVVETRVPGYQAPQYETDDEGNLIVINILDFTKVSVRKVWDDQDNVHQLRPASIILQLQRNGENFGDPVTVIPDDDGNWRYTWEELPKVDGEGQPYIYTVVETAIPGYKAPVYSKDNDGNLVVTNTIDLTSRTAQKMWDDQEDKYGLRPTEIVLQLYRNGLMYLDPVTVTPDEDGNWSYTWNNLPVADSTGNPYVYSVMETPVAHYLPPSYSNDGFTITNRLAVTNVTVNKVWDDEDDKYELRPESIRLQLMQNGVPFGALVTVTPDDDGNWSYTWLNLPKLDAEGEEYVYTVEETRVNGYLAPVYGSDDDGNLIVTNKLEMTDITAKKIWDDQADKYGLRPESITLQLQRNGENFGDPVTVTPDADGNWHYTWENLPKVDAEGEEYIYTVVETPVPHYQDPTYSDDGLTVTNSLDVTDVTVRKIWDDQEDKYGLRPESITLQLMQNGVPFGAPVTVTPDEDGNWHYTWTDLPKVDAEGEAYIYTVVETPVPHYQDPTYSEDGLTVTNSLDVTDISVIKLWDEEYDWRPESITLQLLQNGVAFGEPVIVTPDEDGNWHYTWTDLPRVDAEGEPYVYEIMEFNSAPFVPIIEGSAENGFTITNHKPTFTVEKSATTDRYHNPGDIITYQVIITNTGQVAIEGLIIEDTLVPFEEMTLEESLTEDGILEVGEIWTLTYTYTITDEDVANGHVLNVVSVTDPLDPENPQEDDEEIFKPSYTVDKMASEETYENIGDILNYTVLIVNTGQVAIENLVIEDSLVPFEDMTLEESMTEDGILEVGETWTLTYQHTVTEEDLERGYVLNLVRVTDPQDPDNPEEDEEDVPLDPKPGMTVEKTAKETTFSKVGEIIHYTVIVTNTGNVSIKDLIIEDTLVPFEDMTLVESKIQDGHLQIGETWTLSYEYKVTQADLDRGSVLNLVAAIDPKNPDKPVEDEEEVPGEKKPSMEIKKVAKEDKFTKLGDIIHYTVVVKNTGNVTLTNLEIEDTLVAFKDMTLVESMTADGHLEVGETWTLTYTYKVTQADVDKGYVLNKVIAKSPEYPDNPVEDEVKVPYEKPKKLPSTGMGSNNPLLVTGIGLLMVTAYLSLKRKRQGK